MALNLWKKITTKELPSTRIGRMDLPSLMNWYETSLMELGASFDKYRYHNGVYSDLDEVFQILEDLHYEIGSRAERNG